MPPKSGRTWPSRDVPAPNATTGISWELQYFKTSETSCVVCTVITADGFTGGNADSSLPCKSRTESFVDMRPSTRAPSAAIWSVVSSVRMRIFLLRQVQTM